MDERHHILDLIEEHQKRLRVREKQAAQYGSNVDPSVLIDIDNIIDKIRELKRRFGESVASEMRNRSLTIDWQREDLQKAISILLQQKKRYRSLGRRINKLSKNTSPSGNEEREIAILTEESVAIKRDIETQQHHVNDLQAKLKDQEESFFQTARRINSILEPYDSTKVSDTEVSV